MKSLKLSAFLFTALLSFAAFGENQPITKTSEISREAVETYMMKVTYTPSTLVPTSKPTVSKHEQEYDESNQETGEPAHCELTTTFDAGEFKVKTTSSEQKTEDSTSRAKVLARFSFPLEEGNCNYTPKTILTSSSSENGYHDMTLYGRNGQNIAASFYILDHMQFQWNPAKNEFTANQNTFDFKNAYLFFDNQNVGSIHFYTDKEWAAELEKRNQPSVESDN